MDFDQFIAPLSVEEFRRDYLGCRPLHLKGEGGAAEARRSILDWARFSELLSTPSHWSDANLKLLLNSRPVFGEHYLSEIRTPEGPQLRADAAKVQMLLGMGASLVANRLEDVSLDVRRITAMLGRQFAATAGANAYGSFKGVRAFNSHCDLHEVFAVQLDGEKNWRIYQNRAQSPVQTLHGADAQVIIDQAKGEVMMTADMEPGDLLYIPRGYYHDALASSDSSLHVTFAVAPLDGRYLFRLLEELCVRDADFRAYLPRWADADGSELATRLGELADKVSAMMRSPMFATEIGARQRALATQAAVIEPLKRPTLDQYVRTDAPGEVGWIAAGAVLRHRGGEQDIGVLAQAAEWALGQATFTTAQLAARFSWLGEGEVSRLVSILTGAGLFAAQDPTI